TRRLIVPLRVVSDVIAEDGTGTGTKNKTTYAYHSLRVDPKGRGPLGFKKVITSDAASGVATFTTYEQAYPYTGAVKLVEKFQQVPFNLLPLAKTEMHYCDGTTSDPSVVPTCSQPGAILPPGTSSFIY